MLRVFVKIEKLVKLRFEKLKKHHTSILF